MTDHICQCGCGEVIPPKPNHRRYTPQYIQAHFLRISLERRTTTGKVTRAANRQPPPDWPVPSGACACGCGQTTPIASVTRRERDQYAGFPLRFINGHNTRLLRGPASSGWRGGRYTNNNGYIFVQAPEHPSADKDGYVLEHRLVYERTHGVSLTRHDIIHHVNGVRDDNGPENLVRTTRAKHGQLHNPPGKPVAGQRHAATS